MKLYHLGNFELHSEAVFFGIWHIWVVGASAALCQRSRRGGGGGGGESEINLKVVSKRAFHLDRCVIISMAPNSINSGPRSPLDLALFIPQQAWKNGPLASCKRLRATFRTEKNWNLNLRVYAYVYREANKGLYVVA